MPPPRNPARFHLADREVRSRTGRSRRDCQALSCRFLRKVATDAGGRVTSHVSLPQAGTSIANRPTGGAGPSGNRFLPCGGRGSAPLRRRLGRSRCRRGTRASGAVPRSWQRGARPALALAPHRLLWVWRPSPASPASPAHGDCCWGRKTPWNRVRLTRGLGTRAASRAMKSSNSKMTCVVPSR